MNPKMAMSVFPLIADDLVVCVLASVCACVCVCASPPHICAQYVYERLMIDSQAAPGGPQFL